VKGVASGEAAWSVPPYMQALVHKRIA